MYLFASMVRHLHQQFERIDYSADIIVWFTYISFGIYAVPNGYLIFIPINNDGHFAINNSKSFASLRVIIPISMVGQGKLKPLSIWIRISFILYLRMVVPRTWLITIPSIIVIKVGVKRIGLTRINITIVRLLYATPWLRWDWNNESEMLGRYTSDM